MYKTTTIALLSIIVFACNRIEVKKEYYSNGRLKSETQFNNGKLDGISKDYSNGGRLLYEQHWENGIKATADYYSQEDYVIRVIYTNDREIKKILVRSDTGKFDSLEKYWAVSYANSEDDTINLNDTVEIKVFLFTENQDSIKRCRVIIGKADSLGAIIDKYKDLLMPSNYILKYSFIPTHLGEDTLTGEIRIETYNSIKLYPFRVFYYVKLK